MSMKRKSDEFDGWNLAISQFDDDDENDDESSQQLQQQQQQRNTEKANESFVEKRIRKIIENTFDEEINYKKYELEKINERIFEAQNMLDKLRVCIICSYYSQGNRLTQAEYINHPAIKSLKCEHLDMAIVHAKSIESAGNITESNGGMIKSANLINEGNHESTMESMTTSDAINNSMSYTQQYEVKICVGNVSKYIAGDMMSSDQVSSQKPPTHKWMVYIRSPQCARLESYIKKVIYFLHSSYKPNDIVEIRSPPFEITRRGWGEFPIQVQIHFKDPRNKRVDVMHSIKLDWTQTGLQTFGGETSASAKLILKPADFILTSNNPTTTTTTTTTTLLSNNTNQSELSSPIPITQLQTDDKLVEKSAIQDRSIDNETNLIETIPDSNRDNKEENVKPSISKLISNNVVKPASLSIIDKPAEVIYKIQPSDVNKPVTTTSHVFLNSLKPASSVCQMPIIKSSNINTSSKTVVDQSAIKRIKLSADQLTKIKSTTSSLLSVVKKEPQQPICIEQAPQPQLIVAQETVVTTNNEATDHQNDLDNELSDSFTYSIESLKRKFRNNIDNTSFEMALKRALPSCPLILDPTFGRHNQEKHQTMDLCASSLHEYYTWPYGKRKAREWMRAVRLKEQVASDDTINPSLCPSWSTKRIVLWLRSHGYTPLEYKNIRTDQVDQEQGGGYVSSYTPVNRLFPFKDTIHNHTVDYSEIDDDEEDLDIVNNNESNLKTGLDKKYAEERERNLIDVGNFIQMNIAEKYIQEELIKLQIKTNPVNIVLPKTGNSESSSKSSNTVFGCNLVEKFLLALFKRFADDIIRQTCSDIYFESSSSSTLNKTTSSIDCCTTTDNKRATTSTSNSMTNDPVQKFPLYLGVKDVYTTLVTHSKYDFLTNKHMGAYKNNTDVYPSFISNSNRIKLKKNYSDSSLVNK